jgi:hypothetical protein
MSFLGLKRFEQYIKFQAATMMDMKTKVFLHVLQSEKTSANISQEPVIFNFMVTLNVGTCLKTIL